MEPARLSITPSTDSSVKKVIWGEWGEGGWAGGWGGGQGGRSDPYSHPMVNKEWGSALGGAQPRGEHRGGGPHWRMLSAQPPPKLPHSEHRRGVRMEGCSAP